MLITDRLEKNAAHYGNKTALIERDPEHASRREITWLQFNDNANRLASALLSDGFGKNTRIIQLMTNALEWLPIYFGILKTGAWAVPLNFRFGSEKILLCTETAEAAVFIFGEEFIDRINAVKTQLDDFVSLWIFTGPEEKLPAYAISYHTYIKKGTPENSHITLKPTDDAALYFTSGTTGTPKAVLLTHANLWSSCEAEQKHHHQTHEDNFLCIPPLYHTGAKMHWFGNFMVGAKSVLLKGLKPKWILEAVSEEQITIVWLLVPWAHDIIMGIENNTISLADYSLDQWRLMHIGAQPVPPILIEKWKRLFPHHDYDTNYGLTESTGPGCIHLGCDNRHKVGAIGIPGHNWDFMISDNTMLPLPGGETGELMVRGPGVMKAYYKNPDETKKTLVRGWLRTGDMARTDKDGFVWLVDRKKDVIITGGENIYPVEIEHFLLENDRIQDAAVIGFPSVRLGEIACAVIMLKPGMDATETDMLDYCQGLPRYKRPRKIIFDDIPRNPTGKIEKPVLRRRHIRSNKDYKKLTI